MQLLLEPAFRGQAGDFPCRGPGQGEGEHHPGAFARFAVRGDVAVHFFRQFLDQGQAEAGPLVAAGGGVVRLVKAVKNVGDLFCADADAGVGNANGEAAVLGGGVDRDAAAGGGEFNGVAEQIEEYPLQGVGVRGNDHGRRGNVFVDGDLAGVRHGQHGVDNGGEEGVHFDVLDF